MLKAAVVGVVECVFDSVPLGPRPYGLYLGIIRFDAHACEIVDDALPRFVMKGPSRDPERAFIQGQGDLLWLPPTLTVDMLEQQST